MSKQLVIGHTLADPKAKPGEPVYVDTDMLLDGGLLIAASSGRGKSHSFRKLIEETNGKCQQIVIDVEGEFSTLRELPDSNYLIAGVGEDADLQISINIAEQLAMRVLETNIDIIIDISEFDTDVEQHRFVGRFLKALIHIPKSLWGRKTVVFVDEAHEMAPQTMRKGQETIASDAMVMLAKKARKRGIRGIFATQRIADLRKSVISECDNKMIGGLNHFDDRKTVAQDIGLDKEIINGLRKLPKGKFYAVGAAFGFEDPQLIQISDVLKTTHIKSGQRMAAYVPPAEGSKVAKILQTEFKDIETQADIKARNMQEAERLIADLKHKIKQLEGKAPAPKPAVIGASTEAVAKAHDMGYKAGMMDAGKTIEALQKRLSKAEDFAHHAGTVASRTYGPLHDFIESMKKTGLLADRLDSVAKDFEDLGHKGVAIWHELESARNVPVEATGFKPVNAGMKIETVEYKAVSIDTGLSPTANAILKFLAQQHGRTFSKSAICVNTGFSAKSSGVTKALSQLVEYQHITKSGPDAYTVEEGPQLANAKALLGDSFEDRSKFTVEDWANSKLSGSEQKILRTMIDNGRLAQWSTDQIAQYSGVSRTSSGLSKALRNLIDLGLIQRVGPSAYMVNTLQ